ncbi:MFS transporter, partial [Burkholderia sp. Cy-637]|uniref:MFS transporter n=1 Tax=Burkholderia sp. Cy-637 TaxID=2608327 RepID=UPI0014221E63
AEPARDPAEAASDAASRRGARRALFADGMFRRWVLAGSLTQAGAFALVNVFALFIDARFAGQPGLAAKVGLLHALGWCATLAAGPFWGARNDRGDPGRHFVAGALLCALALALMPLAASLWAVALLRVAQGAAYAALAQSMLLACCRAAPPALQGRVTVTARGAMVLGQLLGPCAVLAVLPSLGPAATLWLTATMFVAAAAVARPGVALSSSSVTESR